MSHSVTLEVVNASTTWAVLRPTKPLVKPEPQRDDRRNGHRDVGDPAAE